MVIEMQVLSRYMGIATSPMVAKVNALAFARTLGGFFWFQAAVLAALIAVLYTQVLASLANDWWTEPSLSHGLLIPPLALYIAWTRRHLTFGPPARADNRGLWMVAFACLLYILGKLGAEFFLPRMSFVLLLAGLVWT